MARLMMNGSFLVLAIIGIMLLLSGTSNVVLGGQCQGDMKGLFINCLQYTKKSGTQANPSPACCNAIKNSDVLCVCHNIPEKLFMMLDMQKVFHVTQFCGKPLPPGTKCGTDGSSEP